MVDLTGKQYAYTAVIDGNQYHVGVAVENEKGYYLTDLGPFESYEKAQQRAKELNSERLKLSDESAYRLVGSSIQW